MKKRTPLYTALYTPGAVAAGAALALALTMSAAKMKQFWNHAQRNESE